MRNRSIWRIGGVAKREIDLFGTIGGVAKREIDLFGAIGGVANHEIDLFGTFRGSRMYEIELFGRFALFVTPYYYYIGIYFHSLTRPLQV